MKNFVRLRCIVFFVINRAQVKVGLQGAETVFDFTNDIVYHPGHLFAHFFSEVRTK